MENVWKEEMGAITNRQSDIQNQVSQLNERITRLSSQLTAATEESRIQSKIPEIPPAKVEPGQSTPPPMNTTAWKPAPPQPPAKPMPPQREIPKPPAPRAPQPTFTKDVSQKTAAIVGGFEMQFGRIWLVWIGVLLMLTGLVFLAHYAYTNFIIQWGPLARSLVVFALSGVIAVAGLIIEKSRENLRVFGQILGAGGLAGVFYSIYASHHVEAMRWIPDATVGGGLLLAWTAVMAWMADRRRSELFAGIALLLAFYTVVVTPIAWFTLVANLMLSMGAVFFLFRHRWTRLSLTAMPLTYGAFGFWQIFYQNGNFGLVWPPAAESFPLAAVFLAGYWLVFTLAILLPRKPLMQPHVRSTFAALNNIAFFMLGAFSIPHKYFAEFWLWPVELGIALIGVAMIARIRLPQLPSLARVYQAEGLILLTAGVLIKFQGPELALLLVLECALLQVAAQFHWKNWYRVWSGALGAMATVAALSTLNIFEPDHAIQALVVASVLLAIGFVLSDRRVTDARLRFWPAYYSLLGLVLVFAVTLIYVTPADIPLVLGALAVGLALPLRWHRFREVALIALPLMLLAQISLLFAGIRQFETLWTPSTWHLLGLTIVYGQFWLRQRTMPLWNPVHHVLQAWLAISEVILLLAIFWTNLEQHWVWLLPVLLVLFVAKANFVGSAWSAIAAQLLLLPLMAGILYRTDYIDWPFRDPANWLYALIPLITLITLRTVAKHVAMPWKSLYDTSAETKIWTDWKNFVCKVYPGLSVVVFVVWTYQYVPTELLTAFFGGIALSLGVICSLFQRKFLFELAQVLGVLALLQFTIVGFATDLGYWDVARALNWWDLAGVLAVLLMQILLQIMSRAEWGLSVQRALECLFVSVGVLQLLWFVNEKIMASGWESTLTMAWGLLGVAVFAVGVAVKDRLHRWWGLALLALALGKVLFFDLWELGMGGRIVSCLALGVFLVLLGFFYNRFAESLKKIL